MKKFWIIVILIIAFFALMIFLTYNVPQIKEYALQMSKNRKLPIWIVGLLAPIIYFFKSIGRAFTNILPGKGEEEAIQKENERIQKELDKINSEVARIDQWRKSEIDIQLKEIERLKQSIGILKSVSEGMDADLEKMKNADSSEWTKGKTNKQVFDDLDRYLGLH
jgi:hypothetical protein